MPSIFGQAEVEDDEVGAELVGVGERGLAVVARPRLVALHPQRAQEHLGDLVVVFDDEDAGRAVCHDPSRVGPRLNTG